MKSSFSQLFKKYRLKAEFASLSQFGTALAEKGFIYEESIFSHWQKGNRIPNNRSVILAFISVFIERGAISSIDEVNELLSSMNQGYLTLQEVKKISLSKLSHAPFQVPREISHFIGREDAIKIIEKQISQNGVFLIHGPSGVGKTALAIALGHRLKKKFPDGVLWYKVDSSNPMDILLSIAHTFHENISLINNIEARASIVRSLISQKKVLLILDNTELHTDIRLFLPNSSECTVILTSIHKDILISSPYKTIELKPFTELEMITLFTKIFNQQYVSDHKESISELGKAVGYLPLALHMYAKQLKLTRQSPRSLLQTITHSKTALEELFYENKNLYISIDFSFQSLEKETQRVFLSLEVFKGKDFSLEAVAAINKISNNNEFSIIQKLINASLLEESAKNRFRLHPMIKKYIEKFPINKIFYLSAATYYAKFLEKNRRKNTKYYYADAIFPDLENIQYIFSLCYELKADKELTYLWKHLGMFYRQTGEWNKAVKYGEIAYKISKGNYNLAKEHCYTIDTLCWIYYLSGNVNKTYDLTLEGLRLAEKLNIEYLIALNKQRLGKLYRCMFRLDESLHLLLESLETFKRLKNNEEIAYSYKFLSETYIFKKENNNAIACLQKALTIGSIDQNVMLRAYVRSILGGVYYIEGKLSLAKKYIQEGLDLEIKNRMRLGNRVYNNLFFALIAHDEGNIKGAERYFSLAKQEKAILGTNENAASVYAILYLLKEKLQLAGYYIFE